MAHIIWDWNGTLLDDLHIVVEAVSACVAPLGRGAITANDYRDHFTRPVMVFYENLMRRPVTTDEWTSIDGVFHDTYRSLMHGADLAVDARAAIRSVEDRAGTQVDLVDVVAFRAGAVHKGIWSARRDATDRWQP